MATLIGLLKQFQIDGKCKIRRVRGDADVVQSSKFRIWTTDNHIDVKQSPPRTPQPNGASERSIGVTERSARCGKVDSGASDYLHPYRVSYAAVQANRRPHSC